MQDVFRKVQPTLPEWLSNFFLGTLATIILFTVIDIVVHDGYVLDDISDCWSGNNSERCIGLYETHNCVVGDQLCLGKNYWSLLTAIVQVTGIFLLVGRIVVGKLAGAKTNPMLFVVGGMWYLSSVILFYFGFLDSLYYWLRGIEVPQKLEWLDGVGLFTLVEKLGVTPSVDISDLYLLNFLGIVIYLGIWIFMVWHHKKKTWQRLHLL